MILNTGYQPTEKPKDVVPPTSGPAYVPKVKRSMEETLKVLMDTNVMLMSVLDQLNTRLQNDEDDLRQLLGKVSVLERKVLELRADRPDGRVTDDDQPDLFDWEAEE